MYLLYRFNLEFFIFWAAFCSAKNRLFGATLSLRPLPSLTDARSVQWQSATPLQSLPLLSQISYLLTEFFNASHNRILYRFRKNSRHKLVTHSATITNCIIPLKIVCNKKRLYKTDFVIFATKLPFYTQLSARLRRLLKPRCGAS